MEISDFSQHIKTVYQQFREDFYRAAVILANQYLKVLDEAVIHVKKYLDVITILLDNEKSTIIKTQSLEDKIKLLNTIFLRYKIQFDLIDSDDRKYGIVKGFLLTIHRLIRCNPWAQGGYDPVP